jgi:quercetin dioxygenase-like cupin family protein
MSRRVVTGLDAEGRSCVLIDGPLLSLGGGGAELAWRTASVPADNSEQADCAGVVFDFAAMHSGGTMFMVMEFSPATQEFWHATDTIEYVIMLEGEVTLMLETGEVTVRAGDLLADRGVVHSWKNASGATARAAIVMLPALPLGNGRTV